MPQQPKAHEPTNHLLILERSLPPATLTLLMAIAQEAAAIDMPLYLVGGSVRDMLMGEPVKDLDLVAEGDAPSLASEVSRERSGQVTVYPRFRTATVKLDGQRFDLATAREETYSRAGALPRVTPSTIQADLGRRDFAVNAMAIAVSGPRSGHLLDPFTGEEDLKVGHIRILHPRSFIDDPTRILRAIRYEQRLGFGLERETNRLLLEAVEGGPLDTVSGDRIRRELGLMLDEWRPDLPLLRCAELGVLSAIHPALADGSNMKALAAVGPANTPLEYLAALSYPLDGEQGESLIRRLGMPSRWARVVRDTITLRMETEGDPAARPDDQDPGPSPGPRYRSLDQLCPESVKVNTLLSDSPHVKEMLEVYLTDVRYVKPCLSGRDLISLGASQGPMVGKILRNLRAAKIEGKISTRDEEVQLAESYISGRHSS